MHAVDNSFKADIIAFLTREMYQSDARYSILASQAALNSL